MNRTIAALLVAGLLGAWLTTAAPQAMALPEAGDPLLVEVTSYAPLNPAPDGTITVQGLVANRSDRDVSDLQALLRVSGEPLSSRSEVAAVTDLNTSRRGVAVESTLTNVARTLAPEVVAQVSVTAPLSALPLGRNGVYAMFLEVRSSAGSYSTAFPMPWFPAADAVNPSRLVVLSPIRSAVDLTAGNALQSDHLLRTIQPGGGLYDIAAGGAQAAAAGVPFTWLIDPAVTAAATDIAAGQATLPGPGSSPQAAAASAAAWLQTVAAGAAAGSTLTYVTPYAEVDATAVIAAGMPDLLQQSVSGASEAATASLPIRNGLIAAPPLGNTDADTMRAYARAGVQMMVIRDAVLPPEQRLAYTPSGVSTVPLGDGAEVNAIIPDTGLAEALQRPTVTAADQFRFQAGILADMAMITLELPLSSRTVVMLPPSDADIPADAYAALLAALNQAPYARMAALPALFEPEVPRVPRRVAAVTAVPPPLSTAYLAPIPPIEQRLGAFATVTAEPLLFEQDYRAALLRSASGNWRSRPDQGSALLAAVGGELTSQEQKVTTVSTGTVTFTGATGTLPLTISNGLTQAVDVGVLLESDPAVRLNYTPPGLVRVEAGRRVSVEIPVEVFGTGPLPVSVVLTDREGRPFIATGDLIIRSTGASVAAALVTILGAVALAILVFWRFRRRGTDPE